MAFLHHKKKERELPSKQIGLFEIYARAASGWGGEAAGSSRVTYGNYMARADGGTGGPRERCVPCSRATATTPRSRGGL